MLLCMPSHWGGISGVLLLGLFPVQRLHMRQLVKEGMTRVIATKAQSPMATVTLRVPAQMNAHSPGTCPHSIQPRPWHPGQ